MTAWTLSRRPEYADLNEAQKTAARAIANLPAQVRLQAMLDGAVRNMDAKIAFARANGIEPPGVLVQMVADARNRATETRAKLREVQEACRNAVREGVFRGWFTYQQAVDSGIFAAPANSGLGIAPLLIIAVAAAIVIVAGGGYYVIQTKLDEHRAAAVAAQNQAAASATQLQAWWTAAGFTGAPATVNPDGSISPPNAAAPTPSVIPGANPTPGTINSNPAGAGLPQPTPNTLSSQLGGVVKWGLVAVAAVLVIPAAIRSFRT